VSSEPQRMGAPVLHGAGLKRGHLAPEDAVVGAESLLGDEVLGGGKLREVGFEFSEERVTRRGVQSGGPVCLL
jgi:hypothetical protein